jgi:hypothetical protein
MNIHPLFLEDTVTVDKSEATEEAPCGAVLPSLYAEPVREEKNEECSCTKRSDIHVHGLRSALKRFLRG